MRSRAINCIVLGCVVFYAACATTQQLAIKADIAYSTAVFALDDAEWTACHTATPVVIPESTCVILDVQLKQALLDVQAVTLAIQAIPTKVPTSLPALLTDLNSIQVELVAAEQIPVITALAAKVAIANADAIALLTQLTNPGLTTTVGATP